MNTPKTETPTADVLCREDDGCPTEGTVLQRECRRLTDELEIERMRLAACGVVALANTPDSAASVRSMHADYRSASCDEVARMVDRQMQYRAALVNLRAGMVDAKNTNIVDYIDAVLGAG